MILKELKYKAEIQVGGSDQSLCMRDIDEIIKDIQIILNHTLAAVYILTVVKSERKNRLF
jgi:hypothetical protein